MNVDKIREVVRRQPFKPFVFHLDNGAKHMVKHPEIAIGNEFIMTVDKDGKSVLIAPEAVSSIEFMEAEVYIDEPTIDQL